MTRASFTGSDLSSVFAQIGKATAGSDYQGWRGDAPATSYTAVELNASSSSSSSAKISAEQAAMDSDMYDQWANGLIGDDEWLAYIAKRVAATSGNPKEHEKWVKYQRKYATDISDHQMKYRYEQGEITLDDYIAYQRKTLSGLDSDSQEWRDRNSALNAMVEQRSMSDIGLRAQNVLADINEGKATYDDLLAVYRDGLRSAKPGTEWYTKLESAIADTRDKQRTDAYNGGAEEIQYLFESGKLTGKAAGQRLRSLADQYLKGDKQNYYKTLQAALDYEKYGGATGASGGGGGGGGRRIASRTSIGDTYLARSSTAYLKLVKALSTPGESASYLQKLARDAIKETATSSKFLAANGTKAQVKAMESRRQDILDSMINVNTLDAQTRLSGVLTIGMANVEAQARSTKADAGDGAIKALTDLYNNIDKIARSQSVDETGQPKKTGPRSGPPDETLPAGGPETYANASWLSEIYGARDAIGVILNAVNSGADLTDEDVTRIVKMGDLTRFDLTGKQEKWSVLPEKEDWNAFLTMGARAAQDLNGVHSGARVNIRLSDGSPRTLPIQTVTGSISIGGGSMPANQADPKSAGVADGNILVPMLEMGENGQANMVYAEASPLTITSGGGVTATSVQAMVAFTHPTLKDPTDNKKYLKIAKGQFLTAEQWNALPEAERKKMETLGQVSRGEEIPVDGYFRFYGTDGSAYLFNRETGKTMYIGKEGAEKLPFRYTDAVAGMTETGSLTAVEDPYSAVYVPIARTLDVADETASSWLHARNANGDLINGMFLLGGTPVIDGGTGRVATVVRDDDDGKGSNNRPGGSISDYFDRAAQGRRPGENAYLTPEERLAEARRLTGAMTPEEATAGPHIEPMQSLGPLAQQFSIRGLFPRDVAPVGVPQTRPLAGGPSKQQQMGAAMPQFLGGQTRQWALLHQTRSGPALLDRQNEAAAPHITAPALNPKENEDFAVSTPSVSLATPGASRISVPVGAVKGRRGAAAPPPPAAPKPPPKKIKAKKTTASGAAVGNTRVAS